MLGSATVQGEQEALDDWQLSEGTATIGGAMAPQEMFTVHSFLLSAKLVRKMRYVASEHVGNLQIIYK